MTAAAALNFNVVEKRAFMVTSLSSVSRGGAAPKISTDKEDASTHDDPLADMNGSYGSQGHDVNSE